MKKIAVALFCLTLASSLAFCATEEKAPEQEQEETKVEKVKEAENEK